MSLYMPSEYDQESAIDEFQQLKEGIMELKRAYQRGNVPQLGAALCDVEFHIQEVLCSLEKQYPFFKADDFRQFVRQKHNRKAG